MGPDQGFVVTVAKLPMPHYAFTSGDDVMLSYFCGGLGIANMHALFIHEMCHVFGAADEVGECHCNEFTVTCVSTRQLLHLQ